MPKFPFSMSAMVLLVLSLGVGACAPNVILLDRQTVLEEEAAGTWPDFEAQLLQNAKAAGPLPFPAVKPSESKKRRTTVLNGEAISPDSKKTPPSVQ